MRINHIIEMTEAALYTTYLTSQDRSNFRYKLATIKPYKGNRQKKDKPFWYQKVYDYIADKPYTQVIHGQEADDAMSITQWTNLRDTIKNHGTSLVRNRAGTVICTKDKDLKMVPGWHYTWPAYDKPETGVRWITPLEGTRWFYSQLLMGDAADNILGIHGIGPASQHIKKVQKLEHELEMFKFVKERYEAFFGSYWKFFLNENAQLLWMRRDDNEEWEFPEGWEEYCAQTQEA